MNSHLNVFKPFNASSSDVEIENNLTRALAIALQEDALFLHEVLRVVLKEEHYTELFGTSINNTTVFIDIQQNVKNIRDYSHIYAVSMSAIEVSGFWSQTYSKEYDPYCDIVIAINGIVLVIEAKRNNVDCMPQLYNQIFNIVRHNSGVASLTEEEHGEFITPFDLNWPKLMLVASNMFNVEKAFGVTNRFLSDFVSLVRNHNYKWLPIPPFSALNHTNTSVIKTRIEMSIKGASEKDWGISSLEYKDRMGIEFPKSWAEELLFDINQESGNLKISIFPGNTKGQGYALFSDRQPTFAKSIHILDQDYPISVTYHIKFTSFQKYFTGLYFGQEKLINPELYSPDSFHRYSGRKKRGEDWKNFENHLNKCLWPDWKSECQWDDKIVKSNRNQFDVSFGYQIIVEIPFENLKRIDTKTDDLSDLMNLVNEIYKQFRDNLLV